IVGTPFSLGSGSISLQAGVLQTNIPGGAILPNNLNLNGTATSPVVFTGQPLTFAGPVGLAGSPLLLLNNVTTLTGFINGNVPVTLSSTPVLATTPTGTGSTSYGATGNLVVQGVDN